MKFTNKRALVVGTGKSGVAAVNLLNHVGAQVTLLEGNTSLSSEEIMKRFPKEAEFDLIIGELPEQKMNSIDFVILSPGVPTDLPFVGKTSGKQYTGLGRDRTRISLRKRKTVCCNRHKW